MDLNPQMDNQDEDIHIYDRHYTIMLASYSVRIATSSNHRCAQDYRLGHNTTFSANLTSVPHSWQPNGLRYLGVCPRQAFWQ